MLKKVYKFGLISVVSTVVCFSLPSCEGYPEDNAGSQPNVVSTRADVSEMPGDKYGVTQRMATQLN